MRDVELAEHTSPSPAPVTDNRRAGWRLEDRIPGLMALGLGLTWTVIVGISWATAPPPDPADPITATAYVLSLVFLIALMATAVGIGARRRWGLLASAGGGLLLLGAAAVCLAGGHSGAELYGQLVSGAALTGITVGAWRTT